LNQCTPELVYAAAFEIADDNTFAALFKSGAAGNDSNK
jgi:hypothetical protein